MLECCERRGGDCRSDSRWVHRSATAAVKTYCFGRRYLVRPERLELPAYWFEASRSIQLSYGRTTVIIQARSTRKRLMTRPGSADISESYLSEIQKLLKVNRHSGANRYYDGRHRLCPSAPARYRKLGAGQGASQSARGGIAACCRRLHPQ